MLGAAQSKVTEKMESQPTATLDATQLGRFLMAFFLGGSRGSATLEPRCARSGRNIFERFRFRGPVHDSAFK
jgi:hypothetical protein